MPTLSRWIALIGLSTLPVAASAIEEPAYERLASCEGFEIRRYPATVGARTPVEGDFDAAGNQGFRRLAGYIFGGNTDEERIAMTAPVAQAASPEGSADRWEVLFFMPGERARATLPEPRSDAVEIVELAPRDVAVVEFSGIWREARFGALEAHLRASLAAAGLPAGGAAVWARYDPPWTPWFLRRNEVWVELPAATEAPTCP